MNQQAPELLKIDREFDPLAMQTLDGNGGVDARWKDDGKLTVKFRRQAILNPFKSTQEGRAIFDEKDFITIFTPGSQLTVIDTPVTDGFYLKRFGKQYADWKAGVDAAGSGTPLEHFPFLLNKVALTAELKAMHIHTVEQLSTLPDGSAQKIMGGFELRKTALEWLDTSKAKADDEEKLALKQQLAQLQAQMDTLLKASAQAAPKATAKG